MLHDNDTDRIERGHRPTTLGDMTIDPSRSPVFPGTRQLAHHATSASRPVGPLLTAAAGLTLLFGLTYVAFVRTRFGRAVDQQFLSPAAGGVDDRTGSLHDTAQQVLSTFGNPMLLAVLLTAIVLLGAAGRRGTAGLLGVAVTGASIVGADSLKEALHRPELASAGSMAHNSFPSGHVAAAAGLVFALLLALPRQARWWCFVPGAAGVFVVGAATMIAGWHRLSDVIGGILLAAALTCLAAAARRGVTRAATISRHSGDRPTTGW